MSKVIGVAVAGFLLGMRSVPAASTPADPAALVEAIAVSKDPRIASALHRIEGTDRRLLALRAYLRAGTGLSVRWSWSDEQIATFMQSPENSALQKEIEGVRHAFVAANPGFDLWVNPQVRSLDTQLASWNSNASVARAAAGLLADFRKWQLSEAVTAMPTANVPQAAERFLAGFIPTPIPTLAAPGLSPHGQMRAIDFQIRKEGKTVAGPVSATIKTAWDAAGWTEKLKTAVRSASAHFTGPLESPREPWHYIYSPVM